MTRKPYQEDHDNQDRWLLSYADFITLLFALFVVLYAMSAGKDNANLHVLSASLGQAMGKKSDKSPNEPLTAKENPTSPATTSAANPPPAAPTPAAAVEATKSALEALKDALTPGHSDSADETKDNISTTNVSEEEKKLHEQLQQDRTELTGIAKELQNRLASLVDLGKIRVTQSNWGISVEINASILFAPAEAKLHPEAIVTLQSIAEVLKDQPQLIHVEGYTDDHAISTQQYPSNWELSSARAGSVVRLFIDSGIASERLEAIGHAANHPVAANSTPEGRLRNRRVELQIIGNSSTEKQAVVNH
jgi:chemotaxis protein MotB